MSEHHKGPPSLWQAVARAQDPVVKNQAALERLRACIVAAPPRRRWRLFVSPWVAAVAATGLVTIALWATSWQQPSFRVGASEGAVGMVLAAQADHLPVRFADGSQVVLAPLSRGRVNGLSDSGAEVVLTSGSLEALVVHSEDTRWVFYAGPFEIVVTGTRFVATWLPESQTLDVQMKEGSVRVAGGGLTKDVPVRAGQRFTASEGVQAYSLREHVIAPAVAAPTPAAAVPETQAPTGEPLAAPGPRGDEAQRAGGSEFAPVPASSSARGGQFVDGPESSKAIAHRWAAAAAAGDHQRAFRLAQKRGLDKLVQRLDAPDLLLLADTARYVGQLRPAATAFSALVARFPRSVEATDALFGLGRLAFQQGAWSEAAQWFQKVVDQPRSGPLVEAAWGRLMESLDRAADQRAGRSARDYLERFPTGQHRALAEKIRAGQPR